MKPIHQFRTIHHLLFTKTDGHPNTQLSEEPLNIHRYVNTSYRFTIWYFRNSQNGITNVHDQIFGDVFPITLGEIMAIYRTARPQTWFNLAY